MTNRDQRAEDPFRLNLQQQKKRAKELLKALKAGDQDAGQRFRQHHPKADGEGGASFAGNLDRLAEAQLVIARELGAASWPALKAHIADMELSRQVMEAGARPLDSDVYTLHIRCGSDIKDSLKAAGFVGDFLEYSDPIGMGPVVDSRDFLSIRARFLTDAFGDWMEFSEADALERQEQEEAGLLSAADRYRRIVLWFEHDSFDQLLLARCLAHFATSRTPVDLELVAADGFPGSMRFIGIGQLPPEALRILWETRQTVSSAQLADGTCVWREIRDEDPTALAARARSGSMALPLMGAALERHLRELPSAFNGLGLTEQFILEEAAGGPLPAGRVYRNLMLEREPLPWLGDLMFRFILEKMTKVDTPVIQLDPLAKGEDWPSQQVSLGRVGAEVLDGRLDYMSLNPPERWIGGVCIRPEQPCWRWDEVAGRPVRL